MVAYSDPRIQSCLFNFPVKCLSCQWLLLEIVGNKALLEFKAQLNGTRSFLGNWNESDMIPCGWARVICNPLTQRVTALWVRYPMPIASNSRAKIHFNGRQYVNYSWRVARILQKSLCLEKPMSFLCISNWRLIRCWITRNLPYRLLSGTISPSIGKLNKLRRLYVPIQHLHWKLLTFWPFQNSLELCQIFGLGNDVYCGSAELFMRTGCMDTSLQRSAIAQS